MKKRSVCSRILRAAAFVLAALALLALVNFVPTFSLKTAGMRELSGTHVTVFYEHEQAAAKDVFALAEARGGELADLLGLQQTKSVEIFVYDQQSVMQTKKYGLIAPLLHLDWYIGDNIGAKVLLTSPANPGPAHTYDDNRTAALHELVHAYNSLLNPDMTYWVDNGLAGYLSGQKPSYPVASYSPLPTLEQTRVSGPLAPVTFANFGGYEYSYTYIEYLADTYGWDAVKALAKNGDYPAAFGADEAAVYAAWTVFVKDTYSE
ncbi:MAG TPA: hypothetical protein VN538_12170 [Clostridia bacterium]|nr:hypothetical protein [Clostridia bacterium]